MHNKFKWLILCTVWTLIQGLHIGDLEAANTWNQIDVGSVPVPGASVESDGTWTITGAGADIWGTEDAFHYSYWMVEGDVRITALVHSVEDAHEWTKAGIMIRSNQSPQSSHAMVALTPRKGVNFIRRRHHAAATHDDAHHFMRLLNVDGQWVYQQEGPDEAKDAEGALTDTSFPRWIRLDRQGNRLTAFDSEDGENWNWLGTDTVSMNATALVGLAVSSHHSQKTANAVMSQVQIESLEPMESPVEWGGSGDGLKAHYFSNRGLSGEWVERVDPVVDFDWGRGAPIEGGPSDAFSVRWEAELEAPTTEPYLLHVRSDDRARLWLNGYLVIDEWQDTGLHESTALVELNAGQRYLLRLEFFENRGNALIQLSWSSPSIPKSIIPSSQLYSQISDADGDNVPDVWEAAFNLDAQDPNDALSDANGNGRSNLRAYRDGEHPRSNARNAKALGRGWQQSRVGRMEARGQSRLGAPEKSLVLEGASAPIGGSRDHLEFVHQVVEGDFDIITHLEDAEWYSSYAMAGWMVRADDTASAACVGIGIGALGDEVRFLNRALPYDNISQLKVANEYTWLKLSRKGNQWVAWGSQHGSQWDWLHTIEQVMPEAVLVGLFLNSGDAQKPSSASFSDVLVQPLSTRFLSNNGQVAPGLGDGLKGTYFDGATQSMVERIDSTIDFDWDLDAPSAGIGPDGFTVRWEGFLEAPLDGPYRLEILSDDGARLWLNDVLVIDDWEDSMAFSSTTRVLLEKGQRYELRMEFYERGGEAVAKLLWSHPEIPRQIIPQDRLYSDSTNNGTGGTRPVRGGPRTTELVRAILDASQDTNDDSLLDLGASHDASIEGFQTVLTLNGIDRIASAGEWIEQGESLTSISRRGWLDYQLEVPQDGMYRLQLDAQENTLHWNKEHRFRISIDGYFVEELRGTLVGGKALGMITPWMQAGKHQIRIFWNNAFHARSVRINALRLQSIWGMDANQNGMVDWVEQELEASNFIRTVSDSSFTSPMDLEGHGRFVQWSSILVNDQVQQPMLAPNDGWYTSIDLSQSGTTEVEILFENGGLSETRSLVWEAFEIGSIPELRIRQGDAMKLVSGVVGSNAKVNIDIKGVTRLVAQSGIPVIHRFDTAGEFTLKVGSASTVVKVVASQSNTSLLAWVKRTRQWDASAYSTDVVWEPDVRLDWQDSDQTPFHFKMDRAEQRVVLARTSPGGSILGQIGIDGFELFTGRESGGLIVEEVFEDEDRVLEMAVVVAPVLDALTVQADVVVGGLTMEDGSLSNTVGIQDFDALGTVFFRYYQPHGAITATCHRISAYHEDDFLGFYK